ncbi:hypothetical protein SAMN05660742_11019 [Propionispira arboris]|uniref:Lipoprotein n=1 Tax=Propionispira arboris TaxID=84035 RepID=A0A1H6ZQR1_9FIRM|nr:hypothetical protein [Propionispira arboris]SEJ54504.1 hypothetical protein SAMN05660742_11019 [Propionispira arboris]
MKKRILAVGILFLMVFLITGCGGDDKANALTSLDQRTNVVRDGHLNEHPDVKISDAYNAFFSNPQWKYFESKDGKKVVEFSGNCMYQEKEINVRQQFILGDGNSFTVGALSFNEIEQNKLISAALISKVYDEYYKKNLGTNPSEQKIGVIQKAQKLLNDKGVQGTVLATSLEHSSDGFLSLVKNDKQYKYILCDNVNQQIAEVPFSWKTYNFLENKKQKNAPPLIFDMIILNAVQDLDLKDGAWNGVNHTIPMYALYKFDGNGNVIPGMLYSGWSAKPSHYQEPLKEQKNVDIANLFLTEMVALHENVHSNKVDLPD